MKDKPEFLVAIPDGPIDDMSDSWAQRWITVYSNGGIGFDGSRIPTPQEILDIKLRITKLYELLNERHANLAKAWCLLSELEK